MSPESGLIMPDMSGTRANHAFYAAVGGRTNGRKPMNEEEKNIQAAEEAAETAETTETTETTEKTGVKKKGTGSPRNFILVILLIALLFLSCLVAGLAIRSGVKSGTGESTEVTEATETPLTEEEINAIDEQIFAKNETHPELLRYTGIDTSMLIPYGDYELGGIFISDMTTWDQYFVYADCTLSQGLACVVQDPVTSFEETEYNEDIGVRYYTIETEENSYSIAYEESTGKVYLFACSYGYITFLDREAADDYIEMFLAEGATGENSGDGGCGCGSDDDSGCGSDSSCGGTCDSGTSTSECTSTTDDGNDMSSMDGMDCVGMEDCAGSMDMADDEACPSCGGVGECLPGCEGACCAK
jgi:hypothetical protein